MKPLASDEPLPEIGFWTRSQGRDPSIIQTAWVSPDHESGWAAGTNGVIFRYRNGEWKMDSSNRCLTGATIRDLAVTSDGTLGWAVGDNGLFLQLQGERWDTVVMDPLVTNRRLNSIWIDASGQNGWAVGNQGTILKLRDGQWEKDYTASRLSSENLTAIASNPQGSHLVVTGTRGTVLEFEKGRWTRLFVGLYTDVVWRDVRMSTVTGAVVVIGRRNDDQKLVMWRRDGRWLAPAPCGTIRGSLSLMGGDLDRKGIHFVAGDSLVMMGLGHRDAVVLDSELRADPVSIMAMGQDRLFLFGNGGLLAEYDLHGKSMDRRSLPGSQENYYDVAVRKGSNTGYAVGAQGNRMLVKHIIGQRSNSATIGGGNQIGCLRALAMPPDHQSGWAVGDSGCIVHFDGNMWDLDAQASSLTTIDLMDVWLDAQGTRGWAVGNNGSTGVILRYANGQWTLWPASVPMDAFPTRTLVMNPSGNAGWIFSDNLGALLYWDGKDWQNRETSPWGEFGYKHFGGQLNTQGDQGWVVGENETILKVTDAIWDDAGIVEGRYEISLKDIHIHNDGSTGWAVGHGSNLQHMSHDCEGNPRWRRFPQRFPIFTGNLEAIDMDSMEQNGIAVGQDGLIIHYQTLPIDTVYLESPELSSLEKLDGKFEIVAPYAIQNPKIELLDGNGNPAFKSAIRREAAVSKADHRRIAFELGSNPLSQMSFEGQQCTLQVTMTLQDAGPPVTVAYMHSFRLAGWPKWLWAVLGILGVCLLNLGIIWVSPWSRMARNLILNPVKAHVVGLFFAKYLVTDLLIRYVRIVKQWIFKPYRKNLENSPTARYWKAHSFIPPDVRIGEATEALGKTWDDGIQKIWSSGTGSLWLLRGKSGSGKTALLENWSHLAIQSPYIPLLLRLGGAKGIDEGIAAVLEQCWEVSIPPAVAREIVLGGGFILFLDGLNETAQPNQVHDFVRAAIKHNIVVLTSQYDPGWAKTIPMEPIHLETFDRKQLRYLIEDAWIIKVRGEAYLSGLLDFPLTAKLLSTFITRTQRLPAFRMDIYREMLRDIDHDLARFNLSAMAWSLFQERKIYFDAGPELPATVCQAAVRGGILTMVEQQYRFSHENFQRFLVAEYLMSQEPATLDEWHQRLGIGIGRHYWEDVLEFRGEFIAELVVKGKVPERDYFHFLEEVLGFELEIFSGRLFPQVRRLIDSGRMEGNSGFMELALARLAGRIAG